MNPFLTSLIMGRVLHRERTCPKCKRPQVVPSNMKKNTVACKFCGADISPQRVRK